MDDPWEAAKQPAEELWQDIERLHQNQVASESGNGRDRLRNRSVNRIQQTYIGSGWESSKGAGLVDRFP